MKNYSKTLYSLLIIVIILAGIFFRFWQLGSIPPGVHYDEAYNGMNALWALEKGEYKIFYVENTGREGLHINVIAFFINIFGNNNWGLRTANALWGSLTLIGFYFLLRALRFSRLSVAIGTFMLAFSFWHIVFSRTAYRAIMVPLILVWSLYFFVRAFDREKKQALNFILSGLILGLGFHTYIAFRVAPLIFIFFFLALTVGRKNFWKTYWKSTLIFSICALFIALPLIIYFFEHLSDLIYRSEAVSVFNSPKFTFWQAFSKSLGAHLAAFFASGDKNPRHNFASQPLLPAAWAVLFALGFIISLKEIIATIWNKILKKETVATKWFQISVLGQSIFWVMILPGILSIEGVPHSLRIIGVIPGVFILSVLPLEYFLNFYEKIKNSQVILDNRVWGGIKTLFWGFIAFAVVGGIIQVRTYFYLWPKDVGTLGAYERKLYDFGFLIRDLPIRENNYIIGAFNTFVTTDHKQSSLKSAEFIGYPNSQKYEYYKTTEGIDAVKCDDAQIIFLESDQWLRDRYKEHCPDLTQERFGYDNNKYQFWVMKSNN